MQITLWYPRATVLLKFELLHVQMYAEIIDKPKILQRIYRHLYLENKRCKLTRCALPNTLEIIDLYL